MDIISELLSLRDPAYREFQIKLIPTVSPERVIGVRTPALRSLARRVLAEGTEDDFLSALPHRYFDENQLHAFIISELRDYRRCIAEVRRFLPYIDNWATCDQLSPKVFRRHRAELIDDIRVWLGSDKTYTVRFAEGMLLRHYLEEDFDPAYLEAVAGIRSEEYYISMMTAWYFAEALARQYEAALPYIESRRLDPRTHGKAIQKAIESRRISPERKEYLHSLK